jgi:S-adenosylmethionine:tRNA-ribosyltransferase-isomerase (queuine synthetase)
VIADHPGEPRDAARRLHIGASSGLADRQIGDLPVLLRPRNLHVFNDIRTRLRGHRMTEGHPSSIMLPTQKRAPLVSAVGTEEKIA